MMRFKEYLNNLHYEIDSIIYRSLGFRHETMARGIVGNAWDKRGFYRESIESVVTAWGVSEEQAQKISLEVFLKFG